MKQQYESEVLYKLMERDGLNIPSSFPPYESEIKQYFIEQIKLAYPKLTDYEAEWLLYNYIEYLPADFPIETALNVTQCRFENVVPYAYKSAILSGQTLVNLMTKCKDVYVVRYNDINNPNNNVANISMMKPNTEYTLFYKAKYRTEGEGSGTNGCLKIATSIEQGFIITGHKYTTEYMKYVYKFTTSSVVDCFIFSSTNKFFAVKECVLLEGDHTQVDIPYFEGMKSVKMPVLTTSNEDGTKTNILSTSEEVELCGIGEVQDTLDLMTGEVTERIGEIVLDGNSTFSSVTTQQNGIRIQYNNVNKKKGTNIPVISNKFNFVSYSNTNIPFTVFCGNNSDIYFMLPLNSNVTSIADAKNWFNENNTIIQFPLTTEIVKTVDLTVVNQDGEECYFMPIEGTMHMATNAQTIKPLLDVEVPVEAITQNLASFINMKMNDEGE